MATIRDHVNVQANLATATSPQQSFGLQLCLVDDLQIPYDVRYRLTSPTSWATDFAEGSKPYEYAQTFFSQKRQATQLMVGRWASGAQQAAAGETRAYKAGSVGPYALTPAATIVLNTDNDGNQTITFDAAAGYQTDTTTYPVTDQAGLTCVITLDGGSAQTITFSGAHTTAAQIIASINAQLIGGSAEASTTHVKVKSDKMGTGSSVSVAAGTGNLTWGAAVSGTGDVANIAAVTAAEVKTRIEADSIATVTVNGSGFTIYSPTYGAASELDFVSGAAITPLGLTVEVIAGAATPDYNRVSYTVFPDFDTTLANWTGITDGGFVLSDGSATDDVLALDFSLCTSIADVLEVLTDGLAVGSLPAFFGATGSRFTTDSLGRVVFQSSYTGAGVSYSVTAADPETGTNINALLGYADQISVEGLEDGETLSAAFNATKEMYGAFYNVGFIYPDSYGNDREAVEELYWPQVVALAQLIESQENLLDVVTMHSDVKDPQSTTDIAYQLKALGLKKTLGIYTERAIQYPDSADIGCVLPASEGTTNFAYEVLANVSDSGLSRPLTVGERTALMDKGCNWIETVGSNTYLSGNAKSGLTFGGEEKRVMLGRDWFVARLREDIFAYQLNQPLAAFDNPTLAAIEGFIWKWINEGIRRGLFLGPATVTIPDADSFDTQTRGTHIMTIANAFTVKINSAVNEYQLTGSLTL